MVLDRYIVGMDGVAEGAVRRSSRHGTLAAGAFSQVLGAKVEGVEKAGSARDQP